MDGKKIKPPKLLRVPPASMENGTRVTILLRHIPATPGEIGHMVMEKLTGDHRWDVVAMAVKKIQ